MINIEAKQSVPEGYKQTEVGVIPEDWRILPFSEALSIRHGKNQKDVESNSGSFPIYGTGGQMGWATDYLYNKPSVLIGRKGTINRPRYTDRPFWTVDTLFYSEIKYLADPKFVFYKFCMVDWTQYNEASGVPSLNASTIEKVLGSFPEKKEQVAIANALSDVDVLISGLEKLIAKKQAIKTATMQQLLTGRTRLPQFALRENGTKKGSKPSELGEIPEDWEVKTYGEVFTFLSTSTNSRADLSEEGDFGYIHYGDIHTKWNNKLDLNEASLPRISKNIVSSAFVMDGDLIMADASEDYDGIGKTVEVFHVGEQQVVAGLHTFLLRDKDKVLAGGFRGYLHSIPAVKRNLDRLATGMKVYGISKNNLTSVCIPIPTLKEQAAIATILTDMDLEIQALEQRLAKTKKLKQGMMQELLTGKTRLVPALNTAATE